MTAIDRLFAEHRLIGRVALAFEQFALTIRDDNQEGRCDFLRFVTFFREYADLLHHAKEEEYLLPALAEAGLRWDEGILSQLQKEHDFERHLLQSLQHLALQLGAWSQDDCRRVIEVCARFVKFMRTHLSLEDAQLFPLIRERLDTQALVALDTKVERFDDKRRNSGGLELLITLGEELIAKYPSLSR